MTPPHKKDKEALGKGIRSLLQSIDADLKTTSGELKSSVVEAVTNMLRISLDQIETNLRRTPLQGRKNCGAERYTGLYPAGRRPAIAGTGPVGEPATGRPECDGNS